MRKFAVILTAALALAGCGQSAPEAQNQRTIVVRGAEQDRLRSLGAFDLAIGLKHAIYDAGYTCKQVTDAGFVGPYQNLDMWMAHCSENRDWAIFAGPDGTAQVRDCRDVPGTGIPACTIKQRPKGSFSKAG